MRGLRSLLVGVVGVVVIASMVGPATVGGVAGATQEQTTLTVQVVDGNDNPLSEATVEATWDGGSATETTKSNGMALVDVPASQSVELDVDHANYVRNFPHVVDNPSETDDVTVRVARKGQATIRTFDSDGNPIGARVTIRSDGREVVSGTSGSDGTFETGTVERRTYTVVAVREGHFRNDTTLVIDGEVEHRVALRQGSVVVEFSVHDDHFDPPRALAETTVEVGDIGSVQTLGSGEATLKVPVNSRHDVSITREGYETVTEQLVVFEEPASLNATISRIPALTINPANRRVVVGESVRVEVRDEYDAPVEGATVHVNGEVVGETDGDGSLRVPVESAGNQTLVATAHGLESEPVAVTGVQQGEGTTPTRTPGTADSPTETAAVDLPGFTPGVAALGLLVVALLLRRQR